MTTPTFNNEREFTRAVIGLAEECHWETFHIQDKAYQTGGVPTGFPDLILKYKDERGHSTLVVAELKTDNDATSQPSPAQLAFLEDLANCMPAYIFRYQDWNYIEDMLRNGPPPPTGKIIRPSLPIVRDSGLLPPQPKELRTIVRQIAEDLANPNFPRRDLAELRRMNPDSPTPPVFWSLMAQHNLPDTSATVSCWALIIHGIALMTPASNAGIPVGRALFMGGRPQRDIGFYSKARLERLLKSQGTIFRALLGRMFKMLASAKQPLEWEELAGLIINDNDAARYQIASDYYRAAPRNPQQLET